MNVGPQCTRRSTNGPPDALMSIFFLATDCGKFPIAAADLSLTFSFGSDASGEPEGFGVGEAALSTSEGGYMSFSAASSLSHLTMTA